VAVVEVAPQPAEANRLADAEPTKDDRRLVRAIEVAEFVAQIETCPRLPCHCPRRDLGCVVSYVAFFVPLDLFNM